MDITIHCESPAGVVAFGGLVSPDYMRANIELQVFNQEFEKYNIPMSECFGRYIDKGKSGGNFVGEFKIRTEPCEWGRLSDLFLEWVAMSTPPDLSGVGYASSMQG